MKRSDVKAVLSTVFNECLVLYDQGSSEYAEDADAFANFMEDAREAGVSQELVLSIFANKHWRGIRRWIKGHKSQRENVRGRLNDMIVYLGILRAMADEADEIARMDVMLNGK